jgi:hypothetical protein
LQITLAQDIGVTERTVKRYIAELVSQRRITVDRRPTTSNIYHFGAKGPQNVPTVGTQNVPTDVPTDVPTFITILKEHSNISSNLISEPPPPQQEKLMSQDPYLPWRLERSAEERKLLRFARRWCDRHAPDAIWPLDGWIIAQQLYDAGILRLPEDAAWSEWPEIEGLKPKATPAAKGGTLEARERLREMVPVPSPMEDAPQRKPAGMEQAIREVKKLIGGNEP